MVKLVSIIIALVLFSMIGAFMFNVAGNMGQTYQSDDFSTYQSRSTSYDRIENLTTQENSTSRGIYSRLSDAVLGDAGDAVDAGVEGIKIIGGSVDDSRSMIQLASGDIGLGLGLFTKTLIGVITVIFIIATLSFLWRAKVET